MKCQKCRFDNPMDAKFCIECGSLMEFHCPKCEAITPAAGKFCMRCGHNLPMTSDIASIDFSQPKSYTPKFIADKILTNRGSIEGERKLVTVFFADVVGLHLDIHEIRSRRSSPDYGWNVQNHVG